MKTMVRRAMVVGCLVYGSIGYALSDELETRMLEEYHATQTALGQDKDVEAKAAAEELRGTVQEWLEAHQDGEEGLADAQKPHVEKMNEGLAAMSAARDLAAVREGFATVSDGLIAYVRADQGTLKAEYTLWYCSMARHYWTQPKGEQKLNPYMGSDMPTCGSRKNW